MTTPVHERIVSGQLGAAELHDPLRAGQIMGGVALALNREVREAVSSPNHAAVALWDQWRPTPELGVSRVVRVGTATLPYTSEQSTAIMPMPGQKHILLPGEWWTPAMLQTLLLRAIGSYPPGSVKFWVADYIKGELNDFKGLSSDMLEYVERGKAGEVIGQLARLQECLMTGRPEEAGSLAAQRHVLVINGNIRLDDEARRHLDYLTLSDNRWGGIVSVDTELPRFSKEADTVQRGLPGGIACAPDPSPPRKLIKQTVEQVSSELRREQDMPFTILDIDEGPMWGASIADGIKIVLGKEIVGGKFPVANLEDLPHVLIGGPTRRGKSVLLNGIIASIVKKYRPEDVEIMFMDGAGTAAAMWASNAPGEPELPHASLLAGNLSADPEFGMEVLCYLEATIKERINATSGRGEKFADLKRVRPEMREIILIWDEFDELLKDEQYGNRAAEKLMYIVQKGAKAGVHFVGATQHVGSIKSLWGSTKGVTDQLGLRVAFNGGESVMELIDNPGNYADHISDPMRRRAWINNNYGRGPAQHNAIVRVADARYPFVQELKRRLPPSTTGRRAVIFNGKERPVLHQMEQYQRLAPGAANAAKAFVGQEMTIEGSAAAVDFSDDFGNNLLVLGTKTDQIANVFNAAAQSLAKQHAPGTASFTIICCDSRQQAAASKLAGELKGGKHDVTFVPDSKRAESFWQEVASTPASDGPQKHYVFVYGADRLRSRAAASILQQVVTQGPGDGIHTVMSASSLNAAEDHALSGGNAREVFESRLIIDGTQRDIERLVDYSFSWSSDDRPGRAILSKDRGSPSVIRLFA